MAEPVTPVVTPPKMPVNLPPTTTAEEDLATGGKRHVALIWEWTQAIISVLVVVANMVVAAYQGYVQTHITQQGYTVIPFPTVLSSSLFLVIGFYFSRTNEATAAKNPVMPPPV